MSLRAGQFRIKKFEGEDVLMVYNMPVLKGGGNKFHRRTFPISLKDPLTPYLVDYVSNLYEDDPLFTYDRFKAYRLITEIDNQDYLKHRNKGEWFPHRVRSERACQLVLEQKAGIFELMRFFGWKKADMPMVYASLRPEDLIRMVLRGKL